MANGAELNYREKRLAAIVKIVDQVVSLIRLGFKITPWVVFIITAGKTVRGLAGETTNIGVDFFINLLSSLNFGTKTAWTVAIIAIAYGILEGQLRRRKTAYLQKRIKELETSIDVKRSSSGLTERGDTPKGDKV